jgi:hypothetical protein
MSDAPEPSTINLVKEVSKFVISKKPISPTSKKLLESLAPDFEAKVRMVQSVYCAQKMSRLGKLASAIDSLQDRIVDPNYMYTFLFNNPAELRKHLALLMESEQADLEYLRSQVAEDAEKEGYSRNPSQQVNVIFSQKVAEASMQESNLSIEERRRTRESIENILKLLDNKSLPQPPKTVDRILEARVEPKKIEEK